MQEARPGTLDHRHILEVQWGLKGTHCLELKNDFQYFPLEQELEKIFADLPEIKITAECRRLLKAILFIIYSNEEDEKFVLGRSPQQDGFRPLRENGAF